MALAERKRAFERWLVNQGADPSLAELDYQKFRINLIRFFWGNDVIGPADYADETIYRILKNLHDNVTIECFDAFAWKVARNVLMEYRRDRDKELRLRSNLPRQAVSVDDPILEGCIERCKEKLEPEERQLIEAFYQFNKGDAIRHRREVAKKLGITPEALRLRAHRIRKKLAACVERCQQEWRGR